MVRGEQRAAEVARSTKPRAGECPSLSLHSRGSGSPIRSPPTACFWGRARKDGPRAAQASAGPLRIREVCAELSGGLTVRRGGKGASGNSARVPGARPVRS
jgi:hypothetical protein